MNNSDKNFRIFSPDGEHVATVKGSLLEETLAFYNDTRRELDIDGNPIGAFRAEEYGGYVAGNR